MEPIVDGLEQGYQDEITFIRLNADTDGNATFRHFNLLGHPSYVFLNPAGEILWSGVGELPLEQIDEVLKSQIHQIDK